VTDPPAQGILRCILITYLLAFQHNGSGTLRRYTEFTCNSSSFGIHLLYASLFWFRQKFDLRQHFSSMFSLEHFLISFVLHPISFFFMMNTTDGLLLSIGCSRFCYLFLFILVWSLSLGARAQSNVYWFNVSLFIGLGSLLLIFLAATVLIELSSLFTCSYTL
jgi:hypothetical protein